MKTILTKTAATALTAIAVTAVLATTGVDQSAFASPAPEVASASNVSSTSNAHTPITGDVTGGVLTINPISEEEFDFAGRHDNCVAQAFQDVSNEMAMCQVALFDNGGGGDRYERVGYYAYAYVGDNAPQLYAQADVTLKEGYVLESTGGTTTNTSPYVRIDWQNVPTSGNPGDSYNGPNIDIPAEYKGMKFQMTLTRPGNYAISSFCSSDPETHWEWQLHCAL